VHLIVVVPVQGADVAQVVAADVGVLLVGLSLHPRPHAVGDGLSGEALFYAAEGLDIRLADGASGLPLGEHHRVGLAWVITIAARCQHTCAADDEDGGQHPMFRLSHRYLISY